MEFRILGPLEVIEDGRELDLGGQKQRALLAVLLLHANEVVSSDRLIEALWEEQPPGSAGKAVQVYVSQLRKVLGRDRVRTRAPGYLLEVAPEELDLARFHALRADGKPREALALWRGAPLSEFAYERFAQVEIARLHELHLACLEDRTDGELADGRHREVVAELEMLVADNPLRDRTRAQLMLALYRSGRQAEALEAFEDARRALVDELGIEPSRELRDLQRAILNQDPGLDLRSGPTAESDGGRAAFVGRSAELSELTRALDDAIAGRGSLFLLGGEPGIGKSRLADELVAHARGRGARVLVGRCWEAGGAPAYWPWVQSLRAYVAAADAATLRRQLGDGAVHVAQLLPELRDLLPELGEPPALESESARFHLFEATTRFLRAAAEAGPLLLVLDDLHAADEPSLLLLQFLARELRDSRLLAVGAYRNVDPLPSNQLAAAVTELAREPVTRTLELRGLDVGDVSRFVELISGEAATDDLVATIHADTEGNPLFVGEIVRLLAAEGGLDGAGAQRLAIPQRVRDVIARRLRHLSDECRRVLVLASVLGREFGLDVLGRLAELPAEHLLDALDEAMAARVVSDVPGTAGRARFAHVLIRDTLYDGLTTARRVRLHRLVIETLESGAGADVAELAHHAIAGSDFEKGLRYAYRAGDRALELLAYEEAARLYAMALEALELSTPADERMRCELSISLGEAQIRAGDSPEAKQTFLQAAGIARRLGLSLELARAAAGYGGRIVWARAGGDARLVPLLEEGLAALPAGNVELRARLLSRLAGALRDEHSRARRERLSAEAVELARSTGNLAALAYALDGRGYAILAPDTTSEILAIGSELREVAGLVGDRERVLAGHMLRIIALLMIGDTEAAEADHDVARRMAEELGQPAQLWQACGDETMLALATGRFDEAQTLIDRAFEYGERALPEAAIPIHTLHRYTLAELRGHDLEGVEPAVAAVSASETARPVFRCALAHLRARLGRADARELPRQLTRDDVAELPFDQEWLFGMGLLAETAALVGDRDPAAVIYPLLEPWAAFSAVDVAEGFRGSIARNLGQLAALLGRTDDAARHFEDALGRNERMGVRPWLAYTQHDYAQLLLARSGPGDRERAGELLAHARATFRELGMREWDGGSGSTPA